MTTTPPPTEASFLHSIVVALADHLKTLTATVTTLTTKLDSLATDIQKLTTSAAEQRVATQFQVRAINGVTGLIALVATIVFGFMWWIHTPPTNAQAAMLSQTIVPTTVVARLAAVERALTDEIGSLDSRTWDLEDRTARPTAALPPELIVVTPLEGFAPVTRTPIMLVETRPTFADGFPNAVGLLFEDDVAAVIVRAMTAGRVESVSLDPESKPGLGGRYLLTMIGNDRTRQHYGLLSRFTLRFQGVARDGGGIGAIAGQFVSAGEKIGYSDRAPNPWVRLGLTLPDGTGLSPLQAIHGFQFVPNVRVVQDTDELVR